ncbi:UDP-N-acetylmuramoyl-tripeptide--D-alanyl-D-alanine ligase [Bizionia argentinensis JUB59]|uniref:UDP-N-acetylmuramoyl-tripeptide--D-alanyl-D-alanine ligase n=1 Tax=Bizionia argentinensis JUB59 TaxID=1046627 RepID=G2EAE1_9FLAO|nr:UDP-N-acetylmuramoyl-tripeptide--D-alanyl-D-alanine ligase [Bizionia argentinensis]EGV44602.1 UDP-N-acetylmuramoyl-tripeptide--D-alanyl-D-alanine ligase [Bizionia argentinensis JUB59]
MELNTIHQRFLECKNVCTDTRKITKDCLFFALKGDNFDGNTFTQQALEKGAKYIIIDNDAYYKDSQTILVEDVLSTLQNLAAYHRDYLGIPIISLTGSNGKTTTKELINAVLSEKYQTTATIGNLNNHIGVPLTLLSMTKDTEIGVVEMGANHLGEIAFLCEIAKPDYGYITNFGKAHLEGFGGIEGVIKGKSELYDYLLSHDKQIFLNTDDTIQVAKTKSVKTISFGQKEEKNQITIQFINANPFVKLQYHDETISSHLIGAYNFNNISAAIAVGNYFKVPDSNIKKAIEGYTPANNRSQIIKNGSTEIILDAYNANPSSMKVALENFSNQEHRNKIIILGDMFELGTEAEKEHQAVVDLVNALNIDKAVFLGENFNKTTCIHPKATFYTSFQAFKEAFNLESLNYSLVLIKGSRGMALERVLGLLDEQ